MNTKLFLFCALTVVSTVAEQNDKAKAHVRFENLTQVAFAYMTGQSHRLREKEASKDVGCLKFQHYSWWRLMRLNYDHLHKNIEAGQHPQQEMENYKTHLKSYQEMLNVCNSSKEFQAGIQTVADTAYPQIDSIFDDVDRFLGYCPKSFDKCPGGHLKARNIFGLLSSLIFNLNTTDDWRIPLRSESSEAQKCLNSLSDGWVHITTQKLNVINKKFDQEGPSQQELEDYKADLKNFRKMLSKCFVPQNVHGQLHALTDVTDPIIDEIFDKVNKLLGYNVDPKEKARVKLGELQDIILKYMRKESGLLREKEASPVQKCLALPSLTWLDRSMNTYDLIVENLQGKKVFEQQLEDFRTYLKSFKDVLSNCDESKEFRNGIKTISDTAYSKIDAVFNELNKLLGNECLSKKIRFIVKVKD